MGKKKNYFLVTIIFVIVFILAGCDDKKEEKETKDKTEHTDEQNTQDAISGDDLVEQTINIGYYYNADKTGEVAIYENGTACYYPNYAKNVYYCGDYSYENGNLTINRQGDYWKFVLEGEQLFYIGCKVGEVVHNGDYGDVYSYAEEKLNVIKCATYTDGKDKISIGENTASLWIDSSFNVKGEWSIENNVVTFGSDKSRAVLELKDGALILKEYWLDGRYYEKMENQTVLQCEYEYVESKISNKMKVGTVSNDKDILPKKGYYYNSETNAELVIVEDDYWPRAEYYPSLYSAANTVGDYSIEDGMFVVRVQSIMETSTGGGVIKEILDIYTVHKFEIRDDKLILREYIDFQDEIHTYSDDEALVFEWAEKRRTDVLRPGVYACENDDMSTIDIDGKGQICISIFVEMIETDEGFNQLDYILFGTYEMKDNRLMAKDEYGNTAELVFQDGKLILEKFNYNGEAYLKEGESKIYTYLFGR